jgi:uncharacterized glyoxalase superfamily protein PhnB
MRYRDVATAADWLCTAFGFEKQTVLTDDSGAPLYAQLTFGRALLMLAPVGDSPIEKFMKQPDEIGGAETQSCYIVVDDADAHNARAKAAGADIVLDVEDDSFGGRGYTCRDPEGHIWTFGTYDPWQGKFPLPEAPAAAPGGGGPRRLMLGGLTAVAIVAVGVAAWFGGALTQSSAVSSPVQLSTKQMPASETAAGALAETRALLEKERTARTAAEKASEEALKRAADAQKSKEAAEQAAKLARAELERAGKVAEGPAAEAARRLDEERRAREAAERGAKQARADLEKVLADKTAAEMAKEFALGRAEEDQIAREAAERAAEEARAELEKVLAAAKSGQPLDYAVLKGSPDMQRALDEAKKRLADEQQAREVAERAAKDARDQLAKEQAARAAAWKVVGQLTKQLKQVQAGGTSVADDETATPKKKVGPPLKKPPE